MVRCRSKKTKRIGISVRFLDSATATIRVKPPRIDRISGNNSERACEKRQGQKEENDESCLERITDTVKRLFVGNGYRDLFDAHRGEISIDSQLGRIPSVVSSSLIPHSCNPACHPLLPLEAAFSFCCSPISSAKKGGSGGPGVSRITTPLSSTIYPIFVASLFVYPS